MNPPEAWIVEEVEHLRIVDQDLWDAVKARQAVTRSEAISDGLRRPERSRCPVHLFSGVVKCGQCGGGYVVVGKTHYGCANHRNKGTCDNRLTIRRDDLENGVLSGLRDRLLDADLIAEFVREYQEEFNRLVGDVRKSRAQAERDLSRVNWQIERIIDAITEGMFHPTMKDKMTALEARKAELEAVLRSDETEPPALLHPGLADIYRQKVGNLAATLNDPTLKQEAAEAIRGGSG